MSKVKKRVEDEDADYDPRKNNAVASNSVGFTRKPRPRTEDFLPMNRRYSTRHKSYSSLLDKAYSGLFDETADTQRKCPEITFIFPRRVSGTRGKSFRSGH